MALKAVRGTRRSLRRKRRQRIRLVLAVFGIVTTIAVFGGGAAVQAGIGCGSCHAMRPFANAHAVGSHAALDCDACHAPGGLLTAPAQGLRAVGWGVAAITGVEPGTGTVSDAPCRSCHQQMLPETVVSRGIAVRHSDFLEVPCTECHAGTGHTVRERHYRTLEMDDCMGCHKSAANDPSSCDLCHSGPAERSEGSTAWRSTHGPGWETTHGMGELKTCKSCHPQEKCISCHGVRVPHEADWMTKHGQTALAKPGEKCVTCHEPDWCTSCHGLEMPHASGFLPGHGPLALDLGEATCTRCHDIVSCHVCHFESSHPAVPGVGMGHEVNTP